MGKLDRAMALTLEEYLALNDQELERLNKEEYGDLPRRDGTRDNQQ